MSRATAAVFVLVLLTSTPRAEERIGDALRRIRQSVDPCGESPQIAQLLKRLDRCPGYEIRTSSTADRNLFDRRIITWNPDLRSELEAACDGDATTPVLRDPTASLLHELVHAVHDCEGRNPGKGEFEAVRIENIYRRAAHLCQRTRYGDAPLPLAMMRDASTCSIAGVRTAVDAPAPADSASPAGDAESAR